MNWKFHSTRVASRMIIYFIFWAASLVAAYTLKSRFAQLAYVAAVFVFVGLRFETGFDWPVYKGGFETLQSGFSLRFISWFADFYQVEFGYVLLVAVAGQIVPEYEYFQAFVTLVFLASVLALCRALGVKNVVLVIALAASFLLLTLMFSTVRQCLAVAIFNYALTAALAKRRASMIALLLFAISIHVSTIFYIVALVFAGARPKMPAPRTVALMAGAGTAAVLSLALIVDYLPTYLFNRMAFYGIDKALQGVSLWQVYFLLLSAFIVFYTMIGASVKERSDTRTVFLRRAIIALAVMCMCTFSLNVVRDRISYEMFLLFALYLAHTEMRFVMPVRIGAVVLGLVFSVLNIFSPLNRIVFEPYQNVILVGLTGDRGTGPARQDAFGQDFEGTHSQ